jgi:hypothetical protein
VIVFTEYRATQKWLVDLLTDEGLGGDDRLMTIYGGMDKDKREAVKAAFQADPSVHPFESWSPPMLPRRASTCRTTAAT